MTFYKDRLAEFSTVANFAAVAANGKACQMKYHFRKLMKMIMRIDFLNELQELDV
ncbi:MAG: hypothetical protein LBI42_08605 [Chitinispirillales bacterium]|nr:hypothetical protein [Chitinispirillales bacterium]